MKPFSLRRYMVEQHPTAMHRLQVALWLPGAIVRGLGYTAGAVFALWFVIGFLGGCSHG